MGFPRLYYPGLRCDHGQKKRPGWKIWYSKGVTVWFVIAINAVNNPVVELE